MTTFTPIDFSQRPSWVDRWLETQELEIEDDLTDCGEVVVFPDHTTKVRLQWDLSEDEFTKLLSCVLFGTAILFPEVSERGNIIWSLLKVVDCMPSICSEIVDCIENDSDVQDALAFSVQNIVNSLEPLSNSLLQLDTVDPSCEPDILFGNITAIWNIIDATTIDVLELFALAGNAPELMGSIVSAIPIIGLLPFDEILTVVSKFGDWTLEAYEGAKTTSLINGIKCDLFCIAVDNCGLTFDQMMTYFGNFIEMGSQVNIKTFSDFINWLFTAVTTLDDLFVYGISLLQLQIVSLAQRYFNIQTINYYVAQGKLGDPSDDWEVLCDDCPQFWNFDSDFTVDQNIFEPRQSGPSPEASWAMTSGWSQVSIPFPPSNFARLCAIECSFDPTYFEDIDAIIDLVKGVYDTNQNCYGIFAFSGGASGTLVASTVVLFNSAVNGADKPVHLDVDATIDYFFVFVRSSLRTSASYSGSCKIDSVHASGQGDNPFS